MDYSTGEAKPDTYIHYNRLTLGHSGTLNNEFKAGLRHSNMDNMFIRMYFIHLIFPVRFSSGPVCVQSNPVQLGDIGRDDSSDSDSERRHSANYKNGQYYY